MFAKKLLAIVLALVAFNIFFFGNTFPIIGTLGFLLLITVAHTFIWIAFYRPITDRKSKLAFITTLLSLLATLLSVFRASWIDDLLLNALATALSFVTLYLLGLSHNNFGAITELASIPLKITLEWLATLLNLIPSFLQHLNKLKSKTANLIPKENSSKKYFKTFIRGLVITIPVVWVVLALLGTADPIFSDSLIKLLKFRIQLPAFLSSMPERLIYSLILLFVATPIALLKINSRFVSPLQKNSFAKYKGEILMLVSALAIALGAFLTVQFKYLFISVPETELHQFGIMTYSEYVRQGFSEMTIVSIIVYLVSAFSLLVYRVKNNAKSWLRKLNIVLLSEMLIFIISIFKRVVVYQAEHGLTRGRFYGMMFLLILIGLTVILGLRQLKANFKNWYLYEAGIVVAMILITPLLNIDHLIATTFQPTVNNQVDYTYITALSPDGIDGWEEAWLNLQADIEYPILRSDISKARKIGYSYFEISNLKRNYEYLIERYGTDEEKDLSSRKSDHQDPTWYRMNFSELQAYQKLRNKISFEEVLARYEYYFSIYRDLSPEMKSPSIYDRSRSTPLL